MPPTSWTQASPEKPLPRMAPEVPPEERSLEMEPMPPQEALNSRPGEQLRGAPQLQDLLDALHRQQAMLLQRFDQQDVVLQSLGQASQFTSIDWCDSLSRFQSFLEL